MSRLTVLVAAGWILMFAAGFAAGRWLDRVAREPGPTYVERLQARYDLDDDQLRQVQDALREEERRIESVLAGVEDEVKESIQEARSATERRLGEIIGPAFATDQDR